MLSRLRFAQDDGASAEAAAGHACAEDTAILADGSRRLDDLIEFSA